MWKAAAIQREVGVSFPGDATLVPVDTLVEAMWTNATAPEPAPCRGRAEIFLSGRRRRLGISASRPRRRRDPPPRKTSTE